MTEARIGALIDDYYAARQARLDAEKAIEELKELEQRLEDQVMAALDDAGLSKATGSNATAYVRESLVAQVHDWEAFHDWVRRNDAFHLLERRVANNAYREELEQRAGTDVPGVTPFTRRKIGLSKA